MSKSEFSNGRTFGSLIHIMHCDLTKFKEKYTGVEAKSILGKCKLPLFKVESNSETAEYMTVGEHSHQGFVIGSSACGMGINVDFATDNEIAQFMNQKEE